MPIFESDRCLLCHDEIKPNIGWNYLISKQLKKYLCEICESKLEFIEGEACRICNRPFNNLEPEYRKNDLCLDCVRWEKDENWSGCFERNTSLLIYNDFLKETIALYKFRGDYVISKAFSSLLKEKLEKLSYDILVPIPLSQERLFERGFNQAEAFITEAGRTPCNILKRIHTEKQSKKSRNERIHFEQVFQINGTTSEITDKRILLIDDIYTTGSTLRHAAKVLKKAGAQSVSSLTLARG